MQFEETVRGTFSGHAGGPISSNTGTPNIRKPGREHGRTASRAASDVSLKVVLPGIWRKSDAASCIFMFSSIYFQLPIRTSCCTLYINMSFQRRESIHFFRWRLSMYIMTQEVRSHCQGTQKICDGMKVLSEDASLQSTCKHMTLAETSLQVFKVSGAFLPFRFWTQELKKLSQSTHFRV